ncbi:MAG: hypothetical protein KDE58_13345 [Caldilineaceae bacterium]|nr:hypothetical protein [Caldilineaceae bacterium]
MLQNRAISPTISSPVSTELADSLERTLADERIRVLKRTFSLPDSLQSFLGLLLILLLICGALMAHLVLSTSLHQSELRLTELQAINRAMEQENTILIQQIAESSSLAKGMERAQQMGYQTAYERRFIVAGGAETAAQTTP